MISTALSLFVTSTNPFSIHNPVYFPKDTVFYSDSSLTNSFGILERGSGGNHVGTLLIEGSTDQSCLVSFFFEHDSEIEQFFVSCEDMDIQYEQ